MRERETERRRPCEIVTEPKLVHSGFRKAFLKARGGRGVAGYVISSCAIL